MDIRELLNKSLDELFPKDPNKITVTEKDHPEKEWFEQAKKMTVAELPAFIEKMIHGYNHDYGTSVHAVSACAIAAAWAACGDESIGLTGFQAGFVMWDFVQNWTKTQNKTGLKLVDYDEMLYPQYAHKYSKTISTYTWEKLQEEAKKNLESGEGCPEVRQHWQKITEGWVPFGYEVKDD